MNEDEEFLKRLEAVKDKFTWTLDRTQNAFGVIRGYLKCPDGKVVTTTDSFCPITAVIQGETNEYVWAGHARSKKAAEHCKLKKDTLDVVIDGADNFENLTCDAVRNLRTQELRQRMLQLLGLKEKE